jgi:hypothetical protein
MLCLGDHHYTLKPPNKVDMTLPTCCKSGSLLWAIEWPIHPFKSWLKPKQNMLKIPILVKHPVIKVAASNVINIIYIIQFGLYR